MTASEAPATIATIAGPREFLLLASVLLQRQKHKLRSRQARYMQAAGMVALEWTTADGDTCVMFVRTYAQAPRRTDQTGQCQPRGANLMRQTMLKEFVPLDLERPCLAAWRLSGDELVTHLVLPGEFFAYPVETAWAEEQISRLFQYVYPEISSSRPE
jgi:hypothetical protein